MCREVFLVRAISFGNKFGLRSDTKRVAEECLMQEAASLQEEIALLQAGMYVCQHSTHLPALAWCVGPQITARIWHCTM